MTTNPSCFISYSWDDNDHKDWVRNLATKLRENGVDTRLDQWDLSLGGDQLTYMETGVRECNFVLLVCTPIFAKKANTGIGGVGYEKIIVTGEIYQKVASPRKFIPVLRKGNPNDSLPSYLKSKMYVDFRNDDLFNSKLEELLRHIYESPSMYDLHWDKDPVYLLIKRRTR